MRVVLWRAKGELALLIQKWNTKRTYNMPLCLWFPTWTQHKLFQECLYSLFLYLPGKAYFDCKASLLFFFYQLYFSREDNLFFCCYCNFFFRESQNKTYCTTCQSNEVGCRGNSCLFKEWAVTWKKQKRNDGDEKTCTNFLLAS